MIKLECPECKSKSIAQIFWGYPANFDEKMEEQVKRKEIVMGGCIVTDHDPNWECNECYNRWGEREDWINEAEKKSWTF